ncbi:MAG: class I SAM-dependent methyltransferase [Deltaproteobacteria bacterium]|nr:class I SAM-dependent methyltransferase [Deltaproteobacteria bacterium]
MHSKLTVFTSVTPSYEYSDELQLCFRMLRSGIPAANWMVYQAEDMSCSLKEFVAQHLPVSGDVLFVREPAVWVASGVYQTLSMHLHADTNQLAILPSDVRGYHPACLANYFTLRGFEQFIMQMNRQQSQCIPYDNRKPWMFLTRAEYLVDRLLPEDPFDLPLTLPVREVSIALDAYIHPFFDYYSETRADMVAFVPLGTNSLLDIGCSRGGFGSAVKAALGCRVAGVEMNIHEAGAATEVLDQVWAGDVLTLDIQEKFDCITCLDVLEHLAEPRCLLEKIRQLLNPGGTLLVSVPNIGHWSIVEDLLAGRWDYGPAGILCNTHLRFYTRHSLLQLLQENGFMPSRVEGQHVAPISGFQEVISHYRNAGFMIDEESLSTLSHIVLSKKQ